MIDFSKILFTALKKDRRANIPGNLQITDNSRQAWKCTILGVFPDCFQTWKRKSRDRENLRNLDRASLTFPSRPKVNIFPKSTLPWRWKRFTISENRVKIQQQTKIFLKISRFLLDMIFSPVFLAYLVNLTNFENKSKNLRCLAPIVNVFLRLIKIFVGKQGSKN